MIEENGNRGVFIVEPGTMATVEDNVIQANLDAGIRVDRRARGVFVRNQIEANVEDAGIRVTRGATAELLQNTIHDNENGVIIVQKNTEVTVTENIITSNRGEGIRVDRSARGILIRNQIEASARQGVRVRRGGVATLTGNTIVASEGVGVEVEDANSDAMLMDNIVTQGMQTGIVVRNGATAIIEGGEMSQHALNGIFLEGMSSADIALAGNPLTIASNSGAGILITDDGSTARIDTARITFSDNAAGDIIGPFMAP